MKRQQNHAMKGVNLGGWLVIEKWITPSLFDGLKASNEFELAKTVQGRERLRRHHQQFITKADLKWLKDHDVKILRVPVGHWIFGDDKRYEPAIERLDWLVYTSLSLGLKLLLDLHAAPGAQNRAAHSGSGNTVSDKHSTKWLNDNLAQERTIEVLEKIASRYRDFPHIWGIELLNEPSVDRFGLKLARFYRRAYMRLTKVARPGTHIIFSDGYAPLRLTNCLWLVRRRDFPVAMDCHIYQVFGAKDKRRTYDEHIRYLKWAGRLIRFLSLQQPLIIGEWSTMLPTKMAKQRTRNYADMQTEVFGTSLAHFYWNYKTEGLGRWNYRDMVDKNRL